MGSGRLTNTAYDTAWMARLYNQGDPLAEKALVWLREHQLSDGSWGAPFPIYHHDRVISTLAAVIALRERNLAIDENRILRGVAAIARHMDHLRNDAAGETIGFEMLLPTLLDEAAGLSMNLPDSVPGFDKMVAIRKKKMAQAPGGMISREVTMSFSTEMAGPDGRYLLDMDKLKEIDGSIGYSPAATAYYLLKIDPQDHKARHWLHMNCHEGGMPDVGAITVFEPAWIIWNLLAAGVDFPDFYDLSWPFLVKMANRWDPERGIGTAYNWGLTDSDDSAVVFDVLTQFYFQMDPRALLNYESETHFRCFPVEKNPSLSANIHLLGAFRRAGYSPYHPKINKLIKFLATQQNQEGFWHDKWHASPMYATAKMLINCASYRHEFLNEAISWMLASQHLDGSWGFYGPTAEETAYCLQALVICKKAGFPVCNEVITAGSKWLARNMHRPYSDLWIGKCLYTPPLVVRSAILSALMLADDMGD
jgi:hypothetical protein